MLKTQLTYYVGSYQQVVDATGLVTEVTQHSDAIRYARTSSLSVSRIEYVHRDHLGSVTVSTTDSGAVIGPTMSFDPYGGRRSANWASDATSTEMTNILAQENESARRGFTDHEMLNRTGLIHMNGRVFDPRIGRFLSRDPVVSGWSNGQSWNRYSYVGNQAMSFSDPSGYAGAPATLRTIEEIVVTANRRPAFPFPPLHFFAIPDPNQVTLDELANLQSIIDVLTRYLDISALLAATEAAKAVPPKDKDKGKDQGNDEAEGKDKSKPQPALPPCAPSPDQLALSGPVTFRFSQGSATVSRGRAGPTSGDVLGTFKTASGYSGTFHTYFDGAFYGTKGFGVSYGTGSSNNLSTFKGVNYNIIGTLGPYSISDNFDPDTLKHVGQTDEFSRLGLGIGVTRSKTFLYTITCPKK